jgi:hypothetical protein
VPPVDGWDEAHWHAKVISLPVGPFYKLHLFDCSTRNAVHFPMPSCKPTPSRNDLQSLTITSTSVLHLIYAIGGRFLETTGQTGNFFCERHYNQALRNIDDILRLHDIRSVQFLLLLSIYSLRSPRGPGAWTYTGLAMRTCIDLGMHRKTQKRKSLLEHEIRKRVFWTCYCLDREVSIILGRPFAISDRDIDVELPLDVDEACEDIAALELAREVALQTPGSSATCSTSMTGFLYTLRLRRIESQVQQSIYRVDQSAPATATEAEKLIEQLEQWRKSMPADADATDPDSMIVDGYDNYVRTNISRSHDCLANNIIT